MCIGSKKGDDEIGPFIARHFPKTEGIEVFDCGLYPEHFSDLSKDFDRVIIIDAVDMNLPAGEIRLVPKEKLPRGVLSTHGIPLYLLVDFLEREGKEVIFIGIQPAKLEGEMSEEVKMAGEKLIKMISEDKLDEIEELRE